MTAITEQRDSRGRFLPFYIPRDEMPQIDAITYPDLFSWLLQRKVRYSVQRLDPNALHFRQHTGSEIVANMSQEVADKPILVSADGYVLDGNHRATWHKLNGSQAMAIQIELPFVNALLALFVFPKSYRLSSSDCIRN
jgi:hypothetical protein